MKRVAAFTLIELLMVIAIIGILAALLMPALGRSLRQADRVQCLNNLRQVGLAFQQFADDHHNRYPMQVSEADGGAREATEAAGDRAGFLTLAPENFPPLERELTTPKLLVCRADRRQPTESFAELGADSVSYRVATNATSGSSRSVLATDRNIEEQREGDVSTNTVLVFGEGMHRFRGNVLMADGRVEWLRGISYRPFEVFPGTPPPTISQQPDQPSPTPGPGPGQVGQSPGRLRNPPSTNQPPTAPHGTLVTTVTTPRQLQRPLQPVPGEPPPETNQTDQVLSAPPDMVTEAPGTVSFIPVQPGEEPARRNWWWWLLLLMVLTWLYLRRRQGEEMVTASRGTPAELTLINAVAEVGTLAQTAGMKKFFTGAAINADLLVTMLEKHDIEARQEHAHEVMRTMEDEFSRETIVYVPETDYERAYELFYGEKGDEL